MVEGRKQEVERVHWVVDFMMSYAIKIDFVTKIPTTVAELEIKLNKNHNLSLKLPQKETEDFPSLMISK
jgi:hypothetical protein